METTSGNKTLIRTFILAAVILAIMVGASQTLGLSKKGFDFGTDGSVINEALNKYYFYIGPAIAFILGIILLTFAEVRLNKKDGIYGDSVAFNSPGDLVKVKWFNNPIKLALLSFIVFIALGLYSSISEQTLFATGTKSLQQQFTFFDNLAFSLLLIPAAENLGAAFFIAFTIFGIRWYSRKNNWSRSIFVALSIVSSMLIIGIYGYLNHILRYGSSDLTLNAVFIFWAIGGFITAITGSFIPFWIMHIVNNLFVALKQNFSNDYFLATAFFIEILLVAIYFFFFVYNKPKKGQLE